jgi:hypothetical protein
MKLEYTLEKSDFVVFQLYAASKSDRIKRKRFRNKIIFPLIYLALGLISLLINDITLCTFSILVGSIWYLFYPKYERNRYIKHYQSYIEENYKNRFGKSETIEFENDAILSKDYTGESKLYLTEIEELNEINDYFFLKFNSGVSLIIPKNGILSSEPLDQYLVDLSTRLNIKHGIDLDWKWK